MDGPTTLIAAGTINGLALVVVIFAVKKVVTTAINGLEKRFDMERTDRLAVDERIWEAINVHGHKGLDKNGSRVTR